MQASTWVEPLRAEIGRVLFGQQSLVEGLLIAVTRERARALEGLPGRAKTSVRARVFSASSRIQFTPDMLADEINRAFTAREK